MTAIMQNKDSLIVDFAKKTRESEYVEVLKNIH